MSSPRLAWMLLSGLAVTPFSGCLSSPAEIPRYFQPRLAEPAKPEPGAVPPALRLGYMTAAAHLSDRMAWRTSEVEIAFDDIAHWTATPDELVADAMQRALFVSGAFRPDAAASTPELNVHVTAFEGSGPQPVAIVELRLSLTAGGAPALVHQLRVVHTAEAKSGPALARAMGLALDDAMRQLVAWLQPHLRTP